MRTALLSLLLTVAPLAVLQAAPITTVELGTAAAPRWQLASGRWEFADGLLTQTDVARGSAALLREPAWGDCRLSVDFNISATGAGVRAAALIFRATGTLTYYWLHLDTKQPPGHPDPFATPGKSWIEIARKRLPRAHRRRVAHGRP